MRWRRRHITIDFCAKTPKFPATVKFQARLGTSEEGPVVLEELSRKVEPLITQSAKLAPLEKFNLLLVLS